MTRRRATILAVVVVAALMLAATWTMVGQGSDVAGSSPRVDKCVERLVARADPAAEADDAELRAYAERTYCNPFDQRGWIYADGALSIRAYEWHQAGASEECMAGEPAQTVPCEELGPETTIDCALLHHVRQSEVRSYLAKLQRAQPVGCDDGTPLADLGAPS